MGANKKKGTWAIFCLLLMLLVLVVQQASADRVQAMPAIGGNIPANLAQSPTEIDHSDTLQHSVRDDGSCTIPPTGPWPPCATGGQAEPPPPDSGSCVIPPSGPWPSCATGGETEPPPPDSGSCIIPPSGPWPSCATGGGGGSTTPTTTPPAAGTPLYKDPAQSVTTRVNDLLARMTLAEKLGQMTLVQQARLEGNSVIKDFALGGSLIPDPQEPNNSAWGWYDEISQLQGQALSTRLGIPLIYGVDAVHGQARAWGTTIFPHNIGLGAANDAGLAQRVGRITAAEAGAMGVNWSFDPVLAVPQDIRWGRTFEAFSEDTARVSSLGAAKLRGLQESGDVFGTPKHFVADGGTQWGSSDWVGGGVSAEIDRGNAIISEAELRSIHLAPYYAALDAGAKSIMVSYSSWNGQKLHANKYLISDVLKGEMGFRGFVVSDWGGIDHIAPGQYDQVVLAINAGIDMVMLPDDYAGFQQNLTHAVERGAVSMERIDDAVRRILTVKFEQGLFEKTTPARAGLDLVGSTAHRAVAREAVQKSLVLLKNDSVLPIAKNSPTIFVAGAKAHDVGVQSGGWTIEWAGVEGNWLKGTSILDGIRQVSGSANVVYDRNGNWSGAGKAPLCVVAIGETPYVEWRGDDGDLALSASEVALLNRIRPNCLKVVGIIISGRPIIISEQLPLMDAVVAAWLPGSEGIGVADVLFGDKPFSGTLPFSWPRTVQQLPFNFADMRNRNCSDALFPMGFGLNVNTTRPPACSG